MIAIGAILGTAVTDGVPGIDLGALGSILVLTGLLWLAVQVGLEVLAARRARPPRPAPPPAPRPAARQDPKPYDPIVPPPRSPRRDAPRPPDPDAPTRRLPPTDHGGSSGRRR
jgi:hypothetical protein